MERYTPNEIKNNNGNFSTFKKIHKNCLNLTRDRISVKSIRISFFSNFSQGSTKLDIKLL